jgi:adenylate kinase
VRTVDVIVLMGAPGAGKGTQANRLCEKVNLPHISTGDLFRMNISEGTELGGRVKAVLDSGQLVSDDLVLDMFFDRVGRDDCASGYILDGFPRTVAQAESLSARLNEGSDSITTKVIDINVPDDVIVGRIAGRLLCRSCGNIQHKEFNAPAKAGVCDACSGELYQRKDDSAETVQERLAVYHEQTGPVIEYFKTAGMLQRLDGTQSSDSVFASLLKVVSPIPSVGGAA